MKLIDNTSAMFVKEGAKYDFRFDQGVIPTGRCLNSNQNLAVA